MTEGLWSPGIIRLTRHLAEAGESLQEGRGAGKRQLPVLRRPCHTGIRFRSHDTNNPFSRKSPTTEIPCFPERQLMCARRDPEAAIGRIYEASTDASRWGDALDAMRRCPRCAGDAPGLR